MDRQLFLGKEQPWLNPISLLRGPSRKQDGIHESHVIDLGLPPTQARTWTAYVEHLHVGGVHICMWTHIAVPVVYFIPQSREPCFNRAWSSYLAVTNRNCVHGFLTHFKCFSCSLQRQGLNPIGPSRGAWWTSVGQGECGCPPKCKTLREVLMRIRLHAFPYPLRAYGGNSADTGNFTEKHIFPQGLLSLKSLEPVCHPG